ncbi:hypothetical protein FRUB_04808 [Fimbriiglobus ruber]|uniref:Uncharacterized protein n=1 Tax=Fimbriiglobus ruber TaxID=1908690 RepID=A0A225DTL0_9BACT|nr:hypothetical protein FRUB_04808 [Fimbriiglobus ruber]
MPAGLPPECRDQLLAFLQSLQMGEPTLESYEEDDSDSASDPRRA